MQSAAFDAKRLFDAVFMKHVSESDESSARSQTHPPCHTTECPRSPVPIVKIYYMITTVGEDRQSFTKFS
jgi:hypothetical protein